MKQQVIVTDWKRGITRSEYVDRGPATASVRGVNRNGHPAGGGYQRPGTKNPPSMHRD